MSEERGGRGWWKRQGKFGMEDELRFVGGGRDLIGFYHLDRFCCAFESFDLKVRKACPEPRRLYAN